MKTKEQRHISIQKKLSIGLIIGIILLASLLYLYHTHWNGLYIVNNIPTSLTGVGIIIGISIMICTDFVLCAILFEFYFPSKPKSKIKINLPNDFVQVRVKEFDNIPLSAFISKDDFCCMAKLDKDGNIIYSFNIKNNFHQTDNLELFAKHFDV